MKNKNSKEFKDLYPEDPLLAKKAALLRRIAQTELEIITIKEKKRRKTEQSNNLSILDSF